MTKEKHKVLTNDRKQEIFYHLVNSLIAGGLVFCSSLASGQITIKGIATAAGAAGIVAITKFKKFWKKEKDEYTKLLNFI